MRKILASPTTALLAALLLTLSCGPVEGRLPMEPTPIVLLAVDGLEWDVLLPLLAEGELPSFARLMERGRYGELETVVPTWSPVIWTSVATGKSRAAHGIEHFVRRVPGGLSLYTSLDRRTKALWNILSERGRRVNVIGWWMTWPVEEIAGVMVAQTNTAAQVDTRAGRNVWKGTLRPEMPHQVFPPARQEEMLVMLRDVEAGLPALAREIFGDFPHPRSELGERLWRNCQWSFRADATYLRIALELAREEERADMTLLYLGGPDVVGHRFWRYRQPSLYRHPPSPQEAENFGRVIDDYYIYIDQALGRLLAVYGHEAVYFIVSDHGMRPVNLEQRFDPDDPPADVNSAEHQDAPPGVFLAAGPGIRPMPPWPIDRLERGDLERVGSVYDLMPTLLAMLRIPQGQDLEGRVLKDLFHEDFQIERQPPAVASHDTPEFLERRAAARPEDPGEEERLRQLRSLGYID